MEDFAGGVRRRVREAREALRAAAESGDDYAAQAYADDLAEMMRLAAEHGIAIDSSAQEG